MIRLECDACEKTFEVDEKTAGDRVSCPHCGDVNRLPTAAAAASAAPASPAARPSRLAQSSGDEAVLAVVRPAMFRAHPFRFTLITIMVLGGAAVLITTAFTDYLWKWLFWVGLIVALFGAAWWVIWWIKTHLWVKITVTDMRTIRQEGIVRRNTVEVMHNHVRSVNIRQNVIQRITNVGYLGIDSAGQAEIEIEVHDIPAPFKVREIIDKHRKMSSAQID